MPTIRLLERLKGIMRHVFMDIRYALRSLSKSPIFTAVAVLSLALGIGANTAIFSLLDQLLLRPLPVVKEPNRLVQMAARGNHYGSNWGMDCMSYPMYRDFRDKLHVYDGLIARRGTNTNLGYAGQVQNAALELISGNYFSVLGITPAIGRVFTEADDKVPNGHPQAVLSYEFWQSRFGGRANVVGETVVLNNRNFTVIGVSQDGFTGMELGRSAQIFAPLAMQEALIPGQKLLEERRTRFLNVFGRLKNGVTIEQARAEVEPLFSQIIQEETKEKAFATASKEDIEAFLRSKMTVFPGGSGTSYLRRTFGPALWVLMSLVGVVLLIACANVANLQLARATARHKEIAVRLSIGAGRWQITRQLLVESLLLACAAGVLGLLLGMAGARLLIAMQPPSELPTNFTGELDPRVLLFTFGVSLITGVLFGIVPALQTAQPDLASTLKESAGSVVGGTHSRFRKALVVLQVTLSLLLLVGAGLFAQSLRNLRTMNPGFRTTNIVMFSVDPNSSQYTIEKSRTFYRSLWEQIQGLPGVEAVGSANMAVVSGNEWDSTITVEGQDPGKSSNRWAFMNHTTPGYFATLGVPLLSGRDFAWSDEITSKPVAIVNEQFVKEYCGGREPIGMHVGMGGDPGTKTDIEIVGVVRNFKYENIKETIGRQMYRPNAQMKFVLNQVFYVRTTREPQSLYNPLRDEVRKLDSNLPVTSMRTIEQQVDRNLSTQRMVAMLSVCFGVLATLLAVLGLYGVMAYLVGRRSREIGIRIALGADSGSVVGMILREVALLVGLGLVFGVAAALGLAGLIRTQLYEVAPNDPVVIVAATLLLATVALVAGWLPANRASQTDPTQVLRYE